MADVNINKFRASVVRDGSKPASPGFIVSEGQDPVDPAGTGQNHLPVTIAAAATGLSITESQVLGGAGTTLQYLRGDGSLATFPDLTGYVPYTGANQTVNLNTQQLQAGHTTLTTNGSTETLTINHTSGSGKAINVTKGGNGEGLYVNKTSGSGNAATIVGTLEATTLVKTGGTSSQFLKADGSVDSTSYGTGTVTSVGLSSATSGVTIGSSPVTTSGTITLTIATASGSQNGLLSSTDWTTFNNKQNALTNPVTGTGTTNYLPKFTGASTIGNSIAQEGTNVLGINITPKTYNTVSALEIAGGATIAGFSNLTFIGSNWYFFGTDKRISTGAVSQYYMTGGSHYWRSAASGAADSNITFIDAMTLTSGGNLLVGTTTDNGARLQVNGTGYFGSTNYSNLIVDGTNSTGWGNNIAFRSQGTDFGYLGSIGSLLGNTTKDMTIWATAGNGFRVYTNGNNKQLEITTTGAATFSGDVTISKTSPTFRLTRGNTSSSSLVVYNTNGTDNWLVGTGVTGTNTDYRIYNNSLGADAIYIVNSNNNVLIGTTTDNGVGKLQVNGNITVAGTVRFSASGADANRWSVYWNGGTGDLIVVNNISDIRAKKDFDYDIKGLETITKLKPLKFTWKDGTSHSTSVSGRLRQYGFIAQETMQADDFLAWHNESHDTWGIEQYESFAAVMVKAIQELKQEIDTLKN